VQISKFYIFQCVCEGVFARDQWQSSRSMLTDRQTEGRADMTKLISAFRNTANAPKNDINGRTRTTYHIEFMFFYLATCYQLNEQGRCSQYANA
jgi:hypothetical protein